MNLAFKFPIIFWNCACLITDSGGGEAEEEQEEEVVDIYEPEDFEEYEYIDAPDRKTKIKKKRQRSTDYNKTAAAMGKMIQSGIQIKPPDINGSSYTFTPSVEDNAIFYGLSGMLAVGEDVIAATIANRPYSSPKDYVAKTKPKKQAMISLIKAGAFDNMMDRKLCMGWYLWETCDKKSNLTLQNMSTLIKYGLLPTTSKEFITARRIYEFNRYLKAKCSYKSNLYKLDDRAVNFLIEIGFDNIISQTEDDLVFVADIKTWEKIYKKAMDIFRVWMTEDKDKILKQLNSLIFKEAWDKYAKGNLSAWEMEAMCFYYHEHELINVNRGKYGITNYFELDEEPVIDRTFYKGGKAINLFKIYKICGTCIAKNKNKALVTLLTPEGVVTVKFRKEYFSMFDKQISEIGADGKKHTIEKSWFNRGSMIMVQGIRSGDNFVAKKYASTGGHTLYHIDSIDEKGDLVLRTERAAGEEEDE